ncbi:hypothetical protein ACFFKH_12790 [Micromonospora marina]|uniref:hypothetical protein n=1 Tax=Micromonospora marina TaxID=307120 RepID=UPI001428BCE2|nr:hypothetical protein [Micromonospora marina]
MSEPSLDGSEVVLGQSAAWIDPMQQGRAGVMSRYPLLVDMGDLVVDPDESVIRTLRHATVVSVQPRACIGARRVLGRRGRDHGRRD